MHGRVFGFLWVIYMLRSSFCGAVEPLIPAHKYTKAPYLATNVTQLPNCDHNRAYDTSNRGCTEKKKTLKNADSNATFVSGPKDDTRASYGVNCITRHPYLLFLEQGNSFKRFGFTSTRTLILNSQNVDLLRKNVEFVSPRTITNVKRSHVEFSSDVLNSTSTRAFIVGAEVTYSVMRKGSR